MDFKRIYFKAFLFFAGISYLVFTPLAVFPVQTEEPGSAENGDAAHFRIEIVAASSSEKAMTIAERLHELIRKPVYIVPDGDRWKVQIGGFSNSEQVEQAVQKLAGIGIKKIKKLKVHDSALRQKSKRHSYGGSGGYTVPVSYLKTGLKIDGTLDEDAWKSAPVLTNFVQSQPHDRAPVSEHTEVRILQDEQYIYFGFTCFDKEPENIVAYEMKRDTWLVNDDYISLYLDTYHDSRNFYNFYVNPLGCRRDAIVTDGQHYNSDWDGIWEAKTSITSEGWIAEIKIPFYTMRFKENGDGTWGANFMRSIRRKRERAYWIPISRDLGRYGAWQASVLES